MFGLICPAVSLIRVDNPRYEAAVIYFFAWIVLKVNNLTIKLGMLVL